MIVRKQSRNMIVKKKKEEGFKTCKDSKTKLNISCIVLQKNSSLKINDQNIFFFIELIWTEVV